MNRLCDEVVQLIFYELIDPGPLTLVSKRFHRFSQDPYVRAHYFLSHYGPTEAMFYALGRGKILSERVLDILFTSGAHLSRYLIQVSMHHYFHTQAHFIKTPWVRTVQMRVFLYFLKRAEEMYGDIPRAKGEDDGSIFNTFLVESRLPLALKTVGWETIREILEKYNFIPFSNKDPLVVQFPLALAIEPRLLPYAVQNGFNMDSKYRDFIFRKMFERPTTFTETLPDEIARNVRELCNLDSKMFVSRTVAAEICMEAKLNTSGYNALKILDKSGHLRFDLACLVEDLIKSFIKTRSISWTTNIETLRYLYNDFPSSDPTARLVMLIIFSNSPENLHCTPSDVHTKLDALNLTPVTREDILNILVNPFVDRFEVLLKYAECTLGSTRQEGVEMSRQEFKGFVGELISRCLAVACKGKLLRKLRDTYGFARNLITQAALDCRLSLEDLPPSQDHDDCARFDAKLCRDYTKDTSDYVEDCATSHSCYKDRGKHNTQAAKTHKEDVRDHASTNLGAISQEPLTTMIRHDEHSPIRSRRRTQYTAYPFFDSLGKLPYPHEPLRVGQWIKVEYGAKSPVTAIFMTHAVINDNLSILQNYFGRAHLDCTTHVPITLKHFQMLARLGRAPNHLLYLEIKEGAEFFFHEDEYLNETMASTRKSEKSDVAASSLLKSVASPSGTRRRKRPRRSATHAGSYAVPGSDDEITQLELRTPSYHGTHMQQWIFHLGELLKEEQRKLKEKKKSIESLVGDGFKHRLAKTEFYKSLSSNLRNLRRVEAERQLLHFGHDVFLGNDSYDDDGDYHQKTRTKRRKVAKSSS